ncbi:MAG: DUF2341 domain-containing protein, partial [Candidatus Pacearchaeota archaeon]|nr:DUF2341 domain-containing protein [Candidatus Pacearchaeota archaeon]
MQFNKKGKISFVGIILLIVFFLFVIPNLSSVLEEKYILGESVKLDFGEVGEYSLKIIAPSEELRFDGEGVTVFRPKEVGEYVVKVSSYDGIDEYSFEVVDSDLEDLKREVGVIQEEDNFKEEVEEDAFWEEVIEENFSNEQIIVGKAVRQRKKVDVSAFDEKVSVEIPYSSENISLLNKESFEVESSVIDSVISLFSDNLTKEIVLYNVSDDFEIEYYTEAPQKKEKIIDNLKKEVVVSASDYLGYENVLSFTEVEEVLKMEEKNSIKIYWKEEGQYLDFEVYDKDADGLIDYVQWIVPHLSEQTFEVVIDIFNAEQLDSNRNLISNVYDEVKDSDGVFSSIAEDDYLRVYFEDELTSRNDITIYAKSKDGARVEVYEKDSDVKIADFGEINDYSEYKVFLNDLNGEESVFDLRVVGGSVEFDYVVDPWMNIDWDKRKAIIISASNVQSDLTDFPILVDIYDENLHDYAQSDGDDILFTASDEVTQLSHEIELFEQDYNSTHAHLVAWVKANLSSLSDNVLYMYYDNSGAINQEDAENVWDSNYVGVWHFSEISGTYEDSTSNNEDSSVESPTSRANSGIAGYAPSFASTSDYVNLPDVINDGEFTVELWFNPTWNGNDNSGHAFIDLTDNPIYFYLGKQTDNNLQFYYESADDTDVQINYDVSSIVTSGNWYYQVGVAEYNSNSHLMYLDGSQVASSTAVVDAKGSMSSSMRIGSQGDTYGVPQGAANAIIDEVRVSNVIRSSDWIDATFKNQNDPLSFYTIGYQESVGSAPATPTPLIEGSFDDDDLNCSEILSDLDGDDMNVTVEWYKDGVLNLTIDYNNSYSDSSSFSSILGSGNTSVGESWSCGLRIFDGIQYSEWGNSSEAVIIDSGSRFSVYRGDFEFASGLGTSTTQSIGAMVDPDHAFLVMYSAGTTAPNNPAEGAVSGYISSPTEITFERNGADDGLWVSWFVVEALDEQFTVRGRGEIELSSGISSNTASVFGVQDFNQAMMVYGLHRGSGTGTGDMQDVFSNVYLQNSTSVIATRDSSATGTDSVVRYEVVEWSPNYNVYTGEVTSSSNPVTDLISGSGASSDAVINMSRSFVLASWTSAENGIQQVQMYYDITDTNELSFGQYNSARSNAIRWYVVESPESSPFNVQRFSYNWDPSTSPDDVRENTIPNQVDSNRSIVRMSCSTSGTGTAFRRDFNLPRLINDTVWSETQYNAATQTYDQHETRASVIEFPYIVNSGAGSALPNITINYPVGIFDNIVPLLNITLEGVANTLWYNIDDGVNVTLCDFCSGEHTSYLFLPEGNHDLSVYANNSVGDFTLEEQSFTIDMNNNFYESFEDNLLVLDYGDAFWEIGSLNYTAIETVHLDEGFESFPVNFSGVLDTTPAGVCSWYRDSGGTPSGGTGPSTGNTGSYYSYLEASSSGTVGCDVEGETAYMTSNFFNLSGINSTLSFYYHMYGSAMGSLAVEINDGSGWFELWSISGQQQTSSSDSYILQNVDLSNYSEEVQIRFVGVRGSDYQGDMAVDDVYIIEPVSRTEVVSKTISTVNTIAEFVNISWNEFSTGFGSVDLQVSVNNGTTWLNAINGLGLLGFIGGTDLKYKAIFEGYG